MTYASQDYDTRDTAKITRFIREFPFAILMPNWAPTTYAMTPLLIHPDSQEDMPVLFGHLDGANPAVDAMASGKVRAIFMGPNGYISPHDYVTEQFPTWNYASVEVLGEISFVQSDSETLQLMKHQIESVEGEDTLAIDFNAPKVQQMLKAIRFFRIEPASMVGRFKFSQEKTPEDRLKAARRLCDKNIRKLEGQLAFLADLEPEMAELAPV